MLDIAEQVAVRLDRRPESCATPRAKQLAAKLGAAFADNLELAQAALSRAAAERVDRRPISRPRSRRWPSERA